MEIQLRAALIDWLSRDPLLSATVNSISEAVPIAAAMPWVALATSAAVDWGCKGVAGAEIRVAFELHCRGDRPDTAGDLVNAIRARIDSLPPAQAGFGVAGVQFMRSRVEARADNARAMLIEYRFRVLAQ